MVSCEIWISLVTETEPVQLFAVLRLIPPWGPPPWVLPPFEELSKLLLQLLAVLACCNPTVTDGMFLLFVVVMVSTMVLALLLLLLGLEIESPLESWS